MNGDCSVILKVQPSEQFVKKVMEEYQGTPVVACLGSRLQEGNRRASNMQAQGIANKTIEQVQAHLQEVELAGQRMHTFAPIRNWSTDNVFDLLRIAGDKPMTKVATPIPAFLSDFGALLEVYGNGSSETCNVAIGQTASGSGCNGKSRFGCIACPMVGEIDKSSTAISAHRRWNALGSENALRLRDYIYRLSSDMSARAFHARAYDSVGFGRVAMQPNLLMPRLLEKLVRLAAQLTLDSIRIAEEFRTLERAGRLMDHPGYADIANDPYMPPKTKKAMLEMYLGAGDAENLHYVFTLEHALLLSFRWALDGVGSAPFRPLAIFKELQDNPASWVPYPKLNSELPEGTLKALSSAQLPEAVMMPVFKVEDAKAFAQHPIDPLTLWSRPVDISDVNDQERNCSLNTFATHDVTAELTFEPSLTLIEKQDGYRIQRGEPRVLAIKCAGKTVTPSAQEALLQHGFTDAMRTAIDDVLEQLEFELMGADHANAQAILANTCGQSMTIKRKVPYFQAQSIFTGYLPSTRQASPSYGFTRRVARVKKGVVQKGTTRLSFYRMEQTSRLHRAHAQHLTWMTPNFDSYTEKAIQLHGAADGFENIQVRLDNLQRWIDMGELDRALAMHDNYFESRIRHRHLRAKKPSLRQFGGTFPAEMMMDTGLITVASSHLDTLRFIIRRTQFFDSLGLFCFQSQNHDAIIKNEKGISMAQHRKDKAEILVHVRQRRNAERRAVRVALQQPATPWQANMAAFEATAKRAICGVATEMATAALHLRFHTHDVPATVQANVYQLWLALHLDQTNVEGLSAHLMTQAQLRVIKEKPADYLQLSKDVCAMATRLTDAMREQYAMWEPTLSALMDVCSSSDKDQAYLQALTRCNWGDVMWKPTGKALVWHVTHVHAKLMNHFQSLNALAEQLEGVAEQGTRKTVRKMTLADKMKLLKQAAA